MINILNNLVKRNIIRPIDLYFSKLISNNNNIIMFIAACISFSTRKGYISIPIQYFENNNLSLISQNMQTILTILNKKKINWLLELSQHQACSDGSIITPLVLFKKKIYLYKIWNAEKNIFKYLYKDHIHEEINIKKCIKILNILFPKKKIIFLK